MSASLAGLNKLARKELRLKAREQYWATANATPQTADASTPPSNPT
jgi:hypothetical protein